MTVEVGTYFVDMLEGLGRQHPGPLGRARILHGGDHRERHVRQHLEPLEAGLFGRRLHRRRAGGRDRRHRADRARLRHRRLHPHSRQLVRRRRAQALAHARLGRPRGGRGRLGLLDELRAGQDRARRGGHARLRVDPAAGRSLHHPQARRALRLARQEGARQAQGRHRARRAGRREGRSRGRRRGRGDRQGAGRHGPHRRAGERRHGRRARRCVATTDLFFFGFDSRLDGYAKRSGHKVGPDTLEPVIYSVYEAAKDITPARFIAAINAANVARRKLGAFYTKYDIWLSPTTARVAEPWGRYHLSKPGVGLEQPDRGAVQDRPASTPSRTTSWARRRCRCRSPCIPPACRSACRSPPSRRPSTCVLQLAAAARGRRCRGRRRVPPLHVSKM